LPGKRADTFNWSATFAAPAGIARVEVLPATVFPLAGGEHAHDVQALATFFKEAAHGVPHIVGDEVAVVIERLAIPEHALVLAHAGDDLRRQVDGTVARWTDESGRGGAHAFDRLGSE
jgi:hypothetical protein